MNRPFPRHALLLLIPLALAGCRESEQGRTVYYEPGVYKGRSDDPPLTQEQRDALRLRAKNAARPPSGGGPARPPSMAWQSLPEVSKRKPVSDRNTVYFGRFRTYWRPIWPYLRCAEERQRNESRLRAVEAKIDQVRGELATAESLPASATRLRELEAEVRRQMQARNEFQGLIDRPCPDYAADGTRLER